MHDLLRDFSISKGNEESFLEIYSRHQVASPTSQCNKSRRLAIHGDHDLYGFLKTYASYLRPFQLFNVGYLKNGFIYKDFKLLGVLDGVPFPSQALSAVGNLIQRMYLGLSLIQVPFGLQLPRWIGKLKNLQTLKVEYSFSSKVKYNYENFQIYTYSYCFPDVIWKLKNLRHLLLHGTNPMNLRLDTLSILRTLKCSDRSWIEEGGLACMTNLQQLKIVELTRAILDLVVSNLERLHCLQSLSLEFRGSQPTPIGLSHFEHLHKLHLAGRINKLPELPQNLVKLSMLYSDLEEDSIGKLERLPNLKFLFLGEGSYNRRKMVYSSEVGFPQLHILRLQLLDDLEKLIVEEEAMMSSRI
ncbi:hypothetical protein CerSpe_281460 [Prunus speciosa]